MNYTTPLSHRSSVYVISASRMFERAGYYGIRLLLIIYMISEAFDTESFSREEAIKIYGIFTGALIATQLLGAVIGDLLVGNRNSMIIGVFLQAIGAFVLSIPSPIFLYSGLGLILLGGGLYSPNVLALFGKQYGDRKKLADSGFMLFYVAINIGAFIGILLLSVLQENFGFSLGFITAGILFILGGVLAILSKDDKEIPDQDLGISVTTRTLNILGLIAITGLFWWLYELSGYQSREIQELMLALPDNPISRGLWQQLNSIFTFIGGLVLFFVWSKVFTSQYFKIAIGFSAATIAFLILYLFPPATSVFHIILLGGVMLLFSIAELFIAPTVYGAIARYMNPKYMAITMSLTFIPGFAFNAVTGLLGATIYQNPSMVLLFCLVTGLFLGIGMFVLHLVIKDRSLQES